jgi:hypothetical protein
MQRAKAECAAAVCGFGLEAFIVIAIFWPSAVRSVIPANSRVGHFSQPWNLTAGAPFWGHDHYFLPASL